jgi:SAM-dependent methyltransferase
MSANPYAHLYDADYFSRQHKLNWLGNNRFRERQRIATIESLSLHPGDRVLELGCGTGLYSFMVAPRVRQVTGIDFAPAAIEKAQGELLDRADSMRNVRFLVADIQSTGLTSGSFDKIFAIDVLEHLSDRQLGACLCEVKRLLARDGRFAFFTPCQSHWIEQLKSRNWVLCGSEGHVGIRSEVDYRQTVARFGLSITCLRRYETCIPVLRGIERLLMELPKIGALFVSRLGVTLQRKGATE